MTGRLAIMLNGHPRAGKDTVADYLRDMLIIRGMRAGTFSSIDPVRDLLTRAGFDLSAKTEEDRRLLATVGDAVEAHSQFRTRGCLNFAINLIAGGDYQTDTAVIVHTREPRMIRHIGAALKLTYGFRVATVFVAGRGVPVTSNEADRNVEKMLYDHYLDNSSSLDNLFSQCRALADQLREESR